MLSCSHEFLYFCHIFVVFCNFIYFNVITEEHFVACRPTLYKYFLKNNYMYIAMLK